MRFITPLTFSRVNCELSVGCRLARDALIEIYELLFSCCKRSLLIFLLLPPIAVVVVTDWIDEEFQKLPISFIKTSFRRHPKSLRTA